ncbi:hypothetical protein SAMN04488012_10647 [Palleronia salina]|uniref:Uncharacterized protein n=1 Tax=Palleronia salina TaxID=313368 RepID=A0A1M6HKD9_9RHOB|nr:hypothetical protein [Palleronia salina]SHJ22633.1 hypothetical protein SAMN04488012_10647 [Palleronia salina]
MSDGERGGVRMVIGRRSLLAGAGLGGVAMLAARPGFAQGSGEGGEGGEGGERGAMPGPSDAAQLLLALGLIEGHLTAGAAVRAEGETEIAMTHMKHPEDEIYSDLVPQLEAAGAEGFAAELQALTAAVQDGGDVEAARDAAQAKIEAARDAADATQADRVRAIAALTRVAADEYDIGIAADGSISNLHEYQDAWGFIQVANRMAERLEPGETRDKVVAALAPTADVFPAILPQGTVEGSADVLYGAAARIDFAIPAT